MIFDSIKNANIYQGISPNLRTALEYMRSHDLNAMEPGRYPIADGKVLIIIKKGFSTRDWKEAKWESHRKEIDIQYLLEGEETIGYCSVDEIKPCTEYDEKTDKILYANEGHGFMTHMKSGDFLILFPDDAHATCLNPGKSSINNKAVIKVALE
ncbi:YhcH/YjgK/YiaL family protein [Lachnospiraceae bacterium 62-35]